MEIFGNKNTQKKHKKHKLYMVMCMYIFLQNCNALFFIIIFYHNIINNKMTHNIMIKIFIWICKYTA